jgi:hypothetical protein
MAKVKSAALGELKTFDNWKRAPLGSLVRVVAATDRGEFPVIGMRCDRGLGGVPHPCLLVLEGGSSGQLFDGGTLRGPALDVTGLVEIRVEDPCPVSFGAHHHNQFGIVCEVSAGSGHLLVRAVTPEAQRVYVWLNDPTNQAERGTVEANLPHENMLIVGVTEVADKF